VRCRFLVVRAACFVAAGIASMAAAQANQVEATDDTGRRIVLAQPARRVVSLAPHITEQLFAIGAGDRIVGTTDYADYPPQAQRIERVARAHSVDLEHIALLAPDLIVVWGSGFPAATIEALKRLRVPVYVNEPGSLAGIAGSLERLGRLTAAPDAPAAAAQLRARIEALRARYAGRTPVRVFYQVWSPPLMTLSRRHVVSEAIELCGGRNVFADLAPLVPQVSVEAVLAADPDLIATAESGAKPSGALDTWRRYPTLRAVKNGQLVTLDADKLNRHTPRIAEEIAVLCERIEDARRHR
jgi:iron complex transport system substrate-binding protein